jgi:hypothetical protein
VAGARLATDKKKRGSTASASSFLTNSGFRFRNALARLGHRAASVPSCDAWNGNGAASRRPWG